ncbi:MAG: ribonuclease P protein component [Candidatus Cloacimonetes bacterium]|nr:ribonuclease P protein component [Candidatus Cloacimonadota bacterium]
MIRWIKPHYEYLEFASAAHCLRSRHFYAPLLPSEGEFAVGITISKKVGNAVKRNRLKRRIKAWLRGHHSHYPLGQKLNIIARKGAAELSWQELGLELQALLGALA